MSRGDVVLLVLYCAALIFLGITFEFPTSSIIAGLIGGGVVFAIRIYLARRTFRR